VGVVQGVEVLAQSVVAGVVAHPHPPLADLIGEAGDLDHAGRQLLQVQLVGAHRCAFELEVIEPQLPRRCGRAGFRG
jgi:hypothetical protein